MDKFLQKSWSNWVITGPLVQVHRKYNIPFFNFFRKSQGGLHQQIINSMDGKKILHACMAEKTTGPST